MDIKDVSFQWFIYFFDKKTAGSAVKNEIIKNKELTEEKYKPIIRKSEKQKVLSFFLDNVCGAALEDMQLLSKFNKEICFLLCVIYIYICGLFIYIFICICVGYSFER